MIVLKYLKLAYHAIRLLINPDGNIKSLIIIGDHIADSKSSNITAQKLLENSELLRMYREKEGLCSIELDRLSTYPKDSLGFILYKFYADQNLDVYPMGRFSQYSVSRYVGERTRKSHDILHVILGYGTDMIGEAKVNAYVINQSRMGISFLIIAGIGIKFLLKSPLDFHSLLDGIEEGWNMGYKTDFFLTQDWEEMMKLPLTQVREQFFHEAMYNNSNDHRDTRQVA